MVQPLKLRPPLRETTLLSISEADCQRCGGFLAALTDVSTSVFHEILKRRVKWKPVDTPDRLIVHKAPHLDEYVAEMLFRAVLDEPDRRREFLETALHAEDDSSARVHWPTAAVFGIGADKPAGLYAQYLFDEHVKGGGRVEDACTQIVAERCFSSLPDSLQRIVDEVSAIDSRGGAHELHLNNLLKTSHLVQFHLGTNADGKRRSGKLPDAWKRAVVNGLLAAVAYCLVKGIDITDVALTREAVRASFGRFTAESPYKDQPGFAPSVQRLQNALDNSKALAGSARVNINGQDLPQLLLAPFMAAAASATWGEELAHFLMVHFWESEILKNISFRRIQALFEESFADTNRPRTIYTRDCSAGGFVIRNKAFKGKRRLRNGTEQEAKYPSPLWVVACRYNNFVLQPNKAMARFLSDNNFGVGILFLENTKETNKVIFRGRHVPDSFWDELVRRLQELEPNVWVRPQPTADFVLNGNASHRYVELSALTPGGIANICREMA